MPVDRFSFHVVDYVIIIIPAERRNKNESMAWILQHCLDAFTDRRFVFANVCTIISNVPHMFWARESLQENGDGRIELG